MGQAAFAATAVAALSLGAVSPAAAQSNCLTADYDTTSWSSGGDSGGFVTNITISNDCGGPVANWTLQLTLPPGHTLQHGWSAEWTQDGDQVSATGLSWSATIAPAGWVSVGFVGAWTGAYQDPLDCTLNGAPCDGGTSTTNDEPPTVTLTQPSGSTASFVPPCPFVLAADATDPDGVDRVEFYLNGQLVGTDHTFPYRVKLTNVYSLPPNSVAFARAYDQGTPQLSADSAARTFSVAIGTPAPNIIFACGGPLQLPAGTSEQVRFLVSSPSSQTVTLTVTGDPGITVSPTTVVSENMAVDVTVTADPDSAGATATITASSGTMQPGSLSVTVLP